MIVVIKLKDNEILAITFRQAEEKEITPITLKARGMKLSEFVIKKDVHPVRPYTVFRKRNAVGKFSHIDEAKKFIKAQETKQPSY